MNLTNFNYIINDQIKHCHAVLEEKGREYALDDDRLGHFKAAASEQEITPKQALWGMASKHFTSLSRMCKTGSDDQSLWLEKITDSINYLLLLRALIEEDAGDEKD